MFYSSLLFFLFFCSVQASQNTTHLKSLIKKYVPLNALQSERLATITAGNDSSKSISSDSFFNNNHPLLYTFYPLLNNNIAYVSLGNFPTPVERLTTLEKQIDVKELWIKRDDLTAYEGKTGGNKVRKLEFLLADALKNSTTSVLTFGCVASNHAVATACYAHQLGLQCILMLKPQPNSHVVRHNLLRMFSYNAQMHWSPNIQERINDTLNTLISTIEEYNTIPYVIPTGGSCPLGILGYVNAVFELKQQIDQGLIPEPDYIFVPAGSKGTAVGLLLGLELCNLQSKLIAIATENEGTPGYFKGKIKELFEATNAFLINADYSFPLCIFNDNQIEVILTSAGKAYGLFTQQGNNATQRILNTENIILDGTYTAKAFSGLLEYVHKNDLSQSVVLYWHTYDSHQDEMTFGIDYHELPYHFHQYFEKEVQPLDK